MSPTGEESSPETAADDGSSPRDSAEGDEQGRVTRERLVYTVRIVLSVAMAVLVIVAAVTAS